MKRNADIFGPAGNVVIATVLDVVKHLMQTRATVQECIKTFDSDITHAKRTHQLGNIKYGSFPESDATSVIDITGLCAETETRGHSDAQVCRVSVLLLCWLLCSCWLSSWSRILLVSKELHIFHIPIHPDPK